MKLQVYAGTNYDNVKPIKVNQNFNECEQLDDLIKVAVRIQDYQNEPHTSNYFKVKEHEKDQFSIQLQITFDQDVSGDDLKWGNDFDKPIRDILPYGFNIGFNIMKWYIDPGLEGEPYIDQPYLYGRALSSMNRIKKGDEWVLIEGEGMDFDSSKERINYFLQEPNRKQFVFKKGETWNFDFYTPYITMGKEFAIKLPGYNLNVEKYCGSQPLRYVLKAGDRVLCCIVFDLQKE